MKKTFLLAVGVFILLLGIQCLHVKKFTFKIPNFKKETETETKIWEFEPDTLTQYSLIAIGGLSILMTLNQQKKQKN